MPKKLEEGILYVSVEYSTCAHLCACGCKEKVRTPLGETNWSVYESDNGPTLFPSIGNWQFPCKSHYWIRDGRIIWAEQWTEEQISSAMENEEYKREKYFESMNGLNWLSQLWIWIKKKIK